MQSLQILLLYYSGTGVTAYTAKQLGAQFQTMGHQVSYHRLTHASPTTFEGYDLMGFGSPVWAWRAPRVVTNALSHLHIGAVPYFTFVSCGGNPGNAQASLFKALKRRSPYYLGSLLVGGANNIRAWRPKLESPTSDFNEIKKEDLEEIPKFCQNLVDKLQKWQENKDSFSFSGMPKRSIFFSFLGATSTYPWQMRMIVGNKWVDSDRCTECGLCSSKICPSGAISVGDDGYPGFDEKLCQACQGCVNLCPELAISSKSTQGKQPLTTYRKYITS